MIANSPVSSQTIPWGRTAVAGWDRFWFTPAAPHTLSLLRVLVGAMLFYTHLVWSFDLLGFLGPQSWITIAVSRELHAQSYAWSYLWYVQSPALLWTLHILALGVFLLFTLGLATRVTSVLALFITLSYSHRLAGAQFGLDQINAMMVMYLMLGASGAAYSLDSILARRRPHWPFPTAEPRVDTNVATRLIQLHMCVIYLFGGIGKLRGDMWWDGSALWYSAGNLEYQSLDITWLGQWPLLVALLSHVTMFWETFYCALVWPRWTRPLALGLAVMVHGGIAVALGMITFGLAMIFGNMAFVSPETVRRSIAWCGSLAARPAPSDSANTADRPPAPRQRRTAPR